MTDVRKIRDLTEQEFFELVQNAVKGNAIEVSGVSVSSTTETLKTLEKTADRLVNKHKDFLLLRKELKLKTGFMD